MALTQADAALALRKPAPITVNADTIRGWAALARANAVLALAPEQKRAPVATPPRTTTTVGGSAIAVDASERILTGFASTVAPDRVGDVLEPRGAQYQLPLPLLFQHHHDKPIGQVLKADVSDAGIKIVAQLAPAGTAAYIDEVWALIRSGLMNGFSVGFLPLAPPTLRKGGGYHVSRWHWGELSLVTIPANPHARIESVKRWARQLGRRHR